MKYQKYLTLTILILLGCSKSEVATLPTVPSNLAANLASGTQVDLTWTDNSTNETGFKIDRKDGSSSQWNTIGSVNANVTAYSDKGLTIGTTYTYRVFSFNGGGNSPTYSNEVSILTKSAPVLTTAAASSINTTSASSGGNISNDGGSSVTLRGICWNTSTNPTTSLTTKTVNGNGIGSFTSALSSLTPNTKYYVRAYAVNSTGTGYGDEITFTTLTASAPTLTTTDVTSISYRTSSSGGQVTADGGAPIIGRGVVWSTTANPTYEANSGFTSNGTGLGSFVSNPSSLQPGTTYYLRAYARNASANGYGAQKTFTTLSLTTPTLTTSAINTITSKTGQSGGNITDDGGTSITAKGICWSTTTNPTIADSKTTDGTGTAAFVSSLAGLTVNIKYYVRAYATNSTGTGYGNEVSFTTAYAIGETGPAGGFIFYDKGVFSNGWRYLEANYADYSGFTSTVWWNGTWTYVDAVGISPDTSLGAGKANTPLIITANSNLNNAAKICDDYTSPSGFTDWYLPSSDELQLMCQNLYSAGIGNFSSGFYWSSTDTNRIHNALWFEFGSSQCNLRTDLGRNMTNKVRPVRQF